MLDIHALLNKVLTPRTINFEQATIDNTVGGIALTAEKYGDSLRAYMTVEGAAIRFRVDGGAPTATVGHLANDGDKMLLESASDIKNFKAIRITTTSAVINVSYSI